jgi:hypothetical protein
LRHGHLGTAFVSVVPDHEKGDAVFKLTLTLRSPTKVQPSELQVLIISCAAEMKSEPERLPA